MKLLLAKSTARLLPEFVVQAIFRGALHLTAYEMQRLARQTRARSANVRSAATSENSSKNSIITKVADCAEQLADQYLVVTEQCMVASRGGGDCLDLDKFNQELERLGQRQKQLQAITSAVTSGLKAPAPLEERSISFVKPPGATLVKISKILFSEKSQNRIFAPIVADMRHEHFEALASNDRTAANMAVVRGWLTFLSAILVRLVHPAWTVMRRFLD